METQVVDVADRDEVVEAVVGVVIIKVMHFLVRCAGKSAEPASPTIAVEHLLAHFLKHGIRLVAVVFRLLHAPLLAFDAQYRQIREPL